MMTYMTINVSAGIKGVIQYGSFIALDQIEVCRNEVAYPRIAGICKDLLGREVKQRANNISGAVQALS